MQDEEKEKKSYHKDDMEFDISYYIAFNLTIYTMVILYALICPLVLPIGAFHFMLSYYIDKYNLTVLYPKEFEGKDDLSLHITTFAELILYLQ